MNTTFQDDGRENEAIRLFDLIKDDGAGRSGMDAYLELDGRRVPFELKSASKASITTVRDFGPDHVAKWQDKHWLIGFYKKGIANYYIYGSPSLMSGWITEKWNYVRPDYELAKLVPSLVTMEQLYSLLGNKEIYSLDDAKKIQKKQYKITEYRALMDVPEGYSKHKMLEILKDRTGYLIRRGSTLNNPHIPASYFDDWEKIKSNHAEKLRSMVRAYFQKPA